MVATGALTLSAGGVLVDHNGDQVVNLASLDALDQSQPDLRSASGWTEQVFSTEDAVCPATALTFEHGQVVMRGSGAGTGARSNRRSVFLIPGSPGGHSRMRSRWSGPSYATALVPQRGHMHGVGTQADGIVRGVVIWHDIVFSAPWVFNIGVWESDPDDLVNGFTANALSLHDTATVSAGSRTSNVVTLTVPSGHGFVKGDVVTVDMTDNTYDGTFPLSAVGATSVSYQQTAADDPSAGTGTVFLARQSLTKSGLLTQYAATDAVRTSGVVTATVAAGHPFQVGDHIGVDLTDATYDGNFAVVGVTATTVVWRQSAADDPSAGSGTLVKVLPYWVESEWQGNIARFRAWPDVTGTPNGMVAPAGPPSWESPWSASVDLSSLGADIPDPGRGVAAGVIGAHLASDGGSTVTEVRYDSLSSTPLPS